MERNDNHEISLNSGRRHRAFKTRLGMLGIGLGIVAAAAAGSYMDRLWLERDFQPIAEAYTQEHGGDAPLRASLVTVTREHGIVGPAIAKLEIFLSQDTTVSVPSYGFEYNFHRIDGEWVLMESGFCTREQCVNRGTLAFQGMPD